jgi:hypothetical protein
VPQGRLRRWLRIKHKTTTLSLFLLPATMGEMRYGNGKP